eukprot:CAMPEP_0171072378 /NCGR_PEP_ID=MMETSP0766_2-20121228/10826_1 /TAXON_ID=439317 /ORGANISM="Gambierdiscus australes, Strain CAWD 149" /LENGTH=162 /DNA_ID=CAMNT_0011528957 /DNA_START=45 /DNA_END=533 /DNA_ORIENTATION=+
MEKTYLCRSTLLEAIGLASAQLGPFWGLFFGIRGPGGRWPEAWWAFLFVVNANTQFWVHVFFAVSWVTRTKQSSFLLFNWFGTEVMEIQDDEIECITWKKGCTGEYVTITRTDEAVRARREQVWCKCCVWKNVNFYLRDHAIFVEDMGGFSSLAQPLGNTIV